jgi:hypothetical protein
MNKTDGEFILFWTLPVTFIIWAITFLVFPGFVHPMSPTMTADQVAAFYRDPANLPRIRYSMVIFNWFACGMIPFLTLIVMQIRRMAHQTPIFAYCYLGCVTCGPALFCMADIFWITAAFRPERDPQLILLFNDLAWVTFIGQVGFMVAQCVFLSVAIYLDRQAKPIFKPWVAHFNLLIAAALTPASFTALAMTGPLAWDGLLSFWLRNIAFTLWIVVMGFVLGEMIIRRRREEQVAV